MKIDKINQIIEELVKLDPKFSNEEKLRAMISDLLELKPDPKIDQSFIKNLKNQLDNRLQPDLEQVVTRLKGNLMNKIMFSTAGVVALVVIILGTLYYNNLKLLGQKIQFNPKVNIVRSTDRAFGSLSQVSLAKNVEQDSKTAEMVPTQSTAPSIGAGVGGRGGDIASFPVPPEPYTPVIYRYVYNGDELNLDKPNMDVLKKIKPDLGEISSSLNSLGLGLVDLGSFGDVSLQYVNFSQEKGYNISADFNLGTITISGFYDVMPVAESSPPSDQNSICLRDQTCPVPTPNPPQIPDDAALIEAATTFLADHNIQTSAYGSPEVARDQLRFDQKATLVYWPESLNVVFPLKINDSQVFDEAGNKVGLTVAVSIRDKKVLNVYELSTQDYQASSYAAETDSDRILEIAQRGGIYGGYYEDPNANIVELSLGTPSLQSVRMWDYSENFSSQIIVPSLIFPIMNPPKEGYFYQKSVIVPVIKDILDRNSSIIGPPVRILDSETK